MMTAKDHLKESGFLRILTLKSALNRGLSSKLREEFPNLVVLSRPKLNPSLDLLNNDWIAGFAAAEGSFSISINNSKDRKLPQVRARFNIGLNIVDEHLLIKVKNQLGIGNLSNKANNICMYEIGSLNDIKEKVIPFFVLHNLNNIKTQDFLDFKKVVLLLDNKAHLTESGLLEIINIRNNMNLRRVLN
jgi:hypothetical protein